MPHTVLVARNGPVTTVTINRPAVRNAVDNPTAEALAEALRQFDGDGDARVAVICGAGGTFCAGADLKAIASGARRERYKVDGEGPMGPTRLALSKPLIAAVSGYAVAGGMEIALLADLRVMEEDAVFGVFCRRWGVPLIDGGTVRLPRIVGEGRALDLILTGRPVGAAEALSMGLANRVVPSGTSRKAAETLAHEIAAFPQLCMNTDRASVYRQWGMTVEDAMRAEFAAGMKAVETEGVQGAAQFAAGAGRHGSFGGGT
ncbi:MAG: crotonase/enoyl-CoA hydratase family protein [Alphaproteobacteria bacterium]